MGAFVNLNGFTLRGTQPHAGRFGGSRRGLAVVESGRVVAPSLRQCDGSRLLARLPGFDDESFAARDEQAGPRLV
jgi:hypothetical protein